MSLENEPQPVAVPTAKPTRSKAKPKSTSKPKPKPKPAEAVAPVAAAVPVTARRRFPFGTAGKVISGVVAAVSLVTGIIAVVPIFTRDATNFGSLRVGAEVYGGPIEYALPATIDISDFPIGAAGTCTPDQQAWLDAHGERITTRYLVDMRNVASEGAMLALMSFRGDGESSATEQLVKVVCEQTGPGASLAQAARLLVSDPGEVAFYDKAVLGQTIDSIPDSPVIWNLAPGETGQIVVALFPTGDFEGTLQLTAVSGAEERDFEIPLAEGGISVPALAFGGLTFLQVSGSLECVRLEGVERVPCPLDQLIQP